MEQFITLLPWGIGLISTIIALKSDWIKSQFTKKNSELEVAASQEDVEAKALDNVEKTMGIYRGMVDDLKETINELKIEIVGLKSEVTDLKQFIDKQKEFIAKQSKSLNYYEKKYGKEHIKD